MSAKTFTFNHPHIIATIEDANGLLLETLESGVPFTISTWDQPWDVARTLWFTPPEGVVLDSVRAEPSEPWNPVIYANEEKGGARGFSLADDSALSYLKHAKDNSELTLDAFGEPSGGGGGEETSLFNRVYLLNEDQAKELSETPLSVFVMDGGELTEIMRDGFVVNLIQVEFKIPENSIIGDSKIIIGDLDTEILAPTLNSDLIPINYGSVEVEGYGNILDYVNSSYKLRLPKIETEIDLAPYEVLGGAFEIVGVLDAYNSSMTVNLYGAEGEPLKSVGVSTGRTIPFRVNSFKGDSTTLPSAASGGFYDTLESARVEVVRGVLSDSEEDNLVEWTGLINSISGFFRVVNYTCSFCDFESDKNELENILEKGVVIK